MSANIQFFKTFCVVFTLFSLLAACKPEAIDPCELQMPDCEEGEPPIEEVESEACKAKRGDISYRAAGGTSLDPAFIGPLGQYHVPSDTTRTGLSTHLSWLWEEPDSLTPEYQYIDSTFRWYVNGEEVANQIEYFHIFDQPGLYDIAYSTTVEKYYADGDTCVEKILYEDTKGELEVMQTTQLKLTDITYTWAKQGDCNEDLKLLNVWERCADIFVISKGHNIRTSTLWDKRWQDDHHHSWAMTNTLQLVGNYTYLELKVYDEDKGSGTVNDDLHHEFLFSPENTQNWSPGVYELTSPAIRSGIGSAKLSITLEAI